jgi:hypothetical protein
MNRALLPREEHAFWLEILEDHAHFAHDHLAPQETADIQQAALYIQAFGALRRQLAAIPPGLPAAHADMIQFSRQAYPVANGYFRFEGSLQSRRILNRININLTPTYFNGTLLENEEYLRILSFYMQGMEFPELPLAALMDMWLEDQLGHAVLLRNVLDPVELLLTEKASGFSQLFQVHMTKNRALTGYLRFIAPGFPDQQQFAKEVRETVQQFYAFVVEVVRRYRGTTVLSRTTLRFLEHHFPESCYFLRKLALYDPSAGSFENCPLTKPSF